MKTPVFDPKDLRPVQALCADGTIPFNPRTAARFCKRGRLPGVKIGNSWFTTLPAARGFVWGLGNPAFKKLTV